ncbi:P-loop containing nucleoside triphosphate hydrolase protein [Flagelloscypha sp. PMI_526]|nr:P-loop containing nucleoside triphosphate hydrolase protein [Flagelloscypha sp. PMI_526]
MAEVVPLNLKSIVLGDTRVGKTSLIFALIDGYFTPKEDIARLPLMLQCGSNNLPLQDHGRLTIEDTYDWDFPPSHNLINCPRIWWTHVAVICFSIVSPKSFLNVSVKWYPLVLEYSPDLKILLVGTMLDLRASEAVLDDLRLRHQAPIQPDQGVALAKSIGAIAYIECSAKEMTRTDEILDMMILNAKLHVARWRPESKLGQSTRPTKHDCVVQ